MRRKILALVVALLTSSSVMPNSKEKIHDLAPEVSRQVMKCSARQNRLRKNHFLIMSGSPTIRRIAEPRTKRIQVMVFGLT